MPLDYAELRDTAHDLIAEFGRPNPTFPQPCYLRSRTEVAGADPWNPAQTDVDTPVQVVVVDYTLREREGTSIAQSDRRALISAISPGDGDPLDISPNASYQLIVGDDPPYEVKSIKPLDPGGVAVMFDAQVSR